MDVEDYNFKLSAGDRVNPVWLRVEGQLKFLLKSARKRLEADQSEAATARLRGEIKSLRAILAFGTDPAPILDDGGEVRTPRRR